MAHHRRPDRFFPRLSSLALVLGLMVAGACGSDGPPSYSSARDNGAKTACDWAARCGNIGDGKTYPTRDACETTWKSNIQNMWPPDTCKRIVQAEYNVCINSLQDATCDNWAVDLLAIWAKCGADKICAAQ